MASESNLPCLCLRGAIIWGVQACLSPTARQRTFTCEAHPLPSSTGHHRKNRMCIPCGDGSHDYYCLWSSGLSVLIPSSACLVLLLQYSPFFFLFVPTPTTSPACGWWGEHNKWKYKCTAPRFSKTLCAFSVEGHVCGHIYLFPLQSNNTVTKQFALVDDRSFVHRFIFYPQHKSHHPHQT